MPWWRQDDVFVFRRKKSTSTIYDRSRYEKSFETNENRLTKNYIFMLMLPSFFDRYCHDGVNHSNQKRNAGNNESLTFWTILHRRQKRTRGIICGKDTKSVDYIMIGKKSERNLMIEVQQKIELLLSCCCLRRHRKDHSLNRSFMKVHFEKTHKTKKLSTSQVLKTGGNHDTTTSL